MVDVNLLTPRKYTVLNGDFMSDLHNFDLVDVFQEHIPGIKWDLTVMVVYIQLKIINE